MKSLLNERDMLEHRLESAVRLQSPVHRLPSELLASIFTTTIMTLQEEDTFMLSTLMLVCRHWKEVVLNTPIIWSRIVTGIHHPLSKAFRKLERSKSIPLQIVVDFSPRVENGSVSTESIVRAIDLLSTSIWRWKTFRLTVPNRPQARAALMRCRDPAPLLEVLSIHVLHSMQEDVYHPNTSCSIFNGQTPSLTSCSMTSFNFGWDMNFLRRLRVLKLGGYWNGYAPSMDTTLSILRACPHLEELSLRNMSDIDSGACEDADPSEVRTNDTRMIHLPRLTKATFYYSGALRTSTILGLLSCPALQSIELSFLDNASPMIEHLHRQSLTLLPLRHLRIESCFLNEMKLARLLRRIPSLTSLQLVDVEDLSPGLLKVSDHLEWVELVIVSRSNPEPCRTSYFPDMGLPQANFPELGRMHDLGLGVNTVGRRIAAPAAISRFRCTPTHGSKSHRGASTYFVRVGSCPATAYIYILCFCICRNRTHIGAYASDES
jgi:hypothetical protein